MLVLESNQRMGTVQYGGHGGLVGHETAASMVTSKVELAEVVFYMRTNFVGGDIAD